MVSFVGVRTVAAATTAVDFCERRRGTNMTPVAHLLRSVARRSQRLSQSIARSHLILHHDRPTTSNIC
jgi:hypothetical protein